MKQTTLVVALLIAAGSTAAPAFAAPSYTATVSGASAASDGRAENAKADFSFNGTFTALSLTLTNTAGSGQLGGVSSILDGISFILGGVPASALSLTSLGNPNGTIACAKGQQTSTCILDGEPVNLSESGWTFKAAQNLLVAGNGSFKPYGVANDNIEPTASIPNAQHSPYLNGPVTFEFAIANPNRTALSLTSATFYFGTVPDVQQAIITSVPEPETYAMLLAGLGLIGTLARRRSSRHA